MSEEPVPYKIPTSVSSPANITLVGGQPSLTMSPEIGRCVDAFVAAYRKAIFAEIPNDNGACELVAKMAYEAQWQIESSLMRQLAHPKGLPA